MVLSLHMPSMCAILTRPVLSVALAGDGACINTLLWKEGSHVQVLDLETRQCNKLPHMLPARSQLQVFLLAKL